MNEKLRKFTEMLNLINQYDTLTNEKEKKQVKNILINHYFNDKNLNLNEILGCETEKESAQKILTKTFEGTIPTEMKTDAVFVEWVKEHYPDDFVYSKVYKNVFVKFYEDTLKIAGNYKYHELMELANQGKIVLTEYRMTQTPHEPNQKDNLIMGNLPNSKLFASSTYGILNACIKNDRVFETTKNTVKEYVQDYVDIHSHELHKAPELSHSPVRGK